MDELVDLDLWGLPMPEFEGPRAKPHRTQANGYAAPPGSGPPGETCGTCRHVYRKRMAREYLKCDLLVRNRRTGGTGSDIRLKSAACSKWESASLVERMTRGMT